MSDTKLSEKEKAKIIEETLDKLKGCSVFEFSLFFRELRKSAELRSSIA